MPTTTSTSPDFEGIKVSVAAAPNGVVGAAVIVGHLETIGDIVAKSRATKKYTPINTKDYEEIVALGSITQGPFNFGVLYDPEASEGVNLLESAIDTNEVVQIVMELNNGTTSGTKITALCKVSDFKVTGEKDGKLLANVTAEKLGKPTRTAAV